MATGGYSDDTSGQYNSSPSDSDERKLSVANVSDEESISSADPSDSEPSIVYSRNTTDRRPQNECVQPYPVHNASSLSSNTHHGSCPSPCLKRQFHAVLHCCSKDIGLAHTVKKQLENMTLPYFGGQFPVRVELLSDVTNKTEIESLHKILKNEMTKVIILLWTDNYRMDQGSQNIGMKIINSESRSTSTTSPSSFDVIELFTDRRLIEENESSMVQSVLYEPESSTFETKMRNILLQRFNDEQVRHDQVRRDCEKTRCRALQTLKKKKNSQAKLPSWAARQSSKTTTESDSSMAIWQNNRGSVPSRYKDTHNCSLSDDTSPLSKSSGDRGDSRSSDFTIDVTDSTDCAGKMEERHQLYQREETFPKTTLVNPSEQGSNRKKSAGYMHASPDSEFRYTEHSPHDLSTASSCSESPSKKLIDHFHRESAVSSKLGDQSESCSSSADKDLRCNRRKGEIKSGRNYNKELNNTRASSDDQHFNNFDSLSTSDPQYIPDDRTIAHEPRGLGQARNPTAVPNNPKHKQTAVVAPIRPNLEDNEDSEQEQTLRKTPRTGNTTGLLGPTVSTSSCTSESSETLQQEVDATQSSARVRPQQQNNARCNPTDPQTDASSELNADLNEDHHNDEQAGHGHAAGPTQLPVSGHGHAAGPTQLPVSGHGHVAGPTQLPVSGHGHAAGPTQLPVSGHGHAARPTQLPVSGHGHVAGPTQLPVSGIQNGNEGSDVTGYREAPLGREGGDGGENSSRRHQRRRLPSRIWYNIRRVFSRLRHGSSKKSSK